MYFLDNNGEIDLAEMANIIDTLDCIEGVEAGAVTYDEDGIALRTESALADEESQARSQAVSWICTDKRIESCVSAPGP